MMALIPCHIHHISLEVLRLLLILSAWLCFVRLMPLDRLAPTILHTATSPEAPWVFIAVWLVCMTVKSSMHLLMLPVTIAAYSFITVRFPLVATFLNILQSVHSKRSYSAALAPPGQTVIGFVSSLASSNLWRLASKMVLQEFITGS